MDINWLKKPASPMIRNIVLGVMAICVIFMIFIGQYMASSVFALIILGDILTNKNRTKWLLICSPTFVGFFVYGMMARFSDAEIVQ